MKLYFSPGACALAPHIMMAELNYVYELEAVNLKDKTCAAGNYLNINAKGSVPALRMENGEILTETGVICQYLADQKNDTTMLPKFGTTERYRCLEWMNFIATEVHTSFSPLFFTKTFSDSETTQNDVKAFYTQKINTKLEYISGKLGNNDYLMGKNFTIADAYMFTVLSWAKYVNMDLSKWTNVTNYLSRIYARPAVQRAMKEEGLLN